MKRYAHFILAALVWVSQTFYGIGDATEFLNTLSVKRAREAKVVPGFDPYGEVTWSVIYRAPDLSWCGDHCD